MLITYIFLENISREKTQAFSTARVLNCSYSFRLSCLILISLNIGMKSSARKIICFFIFSLKLDIRPDVTQASNL